MLYNFKAGEDYPEWMTEESLKTLKRQHLSDNETPKQMYERIVNCLSERLKIMNNSLDIKYIKNKWFDYLWKGWLCPSTPILSNVGTHRKLGISCYILRLDDTLDSIYQKVHEMAMLTKSGGGVGVTFDKVRGRGETISTGGFTEGVIPFIKVYDSAIVAASQGNIRRGSASINLPIRHKDIDEFLNIRLPIGDVNRQCLNINHCVTIDDYFMEDLIKGNENVRNTWAKVLSTRMKTGQPYIMYYHNVHNQRPDDMKKRNLKIDGTNICCLAEDTEVITKEGIFKIQDLVGKEVTIYDGQNWIKCDNFKDYGEDEIWRIDFSNNTYVECNLNHRWFVDNGYKNVEKITTELNIDDRMESDGEVITITHIQKCKGKHKVYCPNIPSTGKFLLANGIITGNSEIMLPHDKDHTVVCDLSSLNLAKWDEWKNDKELVELSLLFLDTNLEEFIVNAKGKKGLTNAVKFAEKARAIGLGVLGLATLLQSKMTPFISIQTRGLINTIANKLYNEGQEYNLKYGKLLGNPEWCDENRNLTLFAIAPTTTNSLISGGVSQGIEPIICNAYVQKSAKGTFLRKNPHFEKLLKNKYEQYNTSEVWNNIAVEYKGSVQHLPFLTDEEKEVFLTAYEINQLELIKNAALWQKKIDQGISLNLFFPSDVEPKWLNKCHITAWEEGIKALYYVRTDSILSKDMKSSTFDDCVFCEG